ncbi:MAG: hypothetical protein WBD30_02220 [Bacteroidota bacterium]
MGTPAITPAAPPPRGQLLLGGSVFVLGQFSPLLVPLVVNSDLPGGWKTAVSGLLMLGVPELAILAAVTILGKSGYEYLKGLILRFLKRHVVPREVSPTRYCIGLVLFLIPILWGWASPYLEHLFGGLEANRLWYAAAGDFLLIVSLLILGGDFWEKLRALFVYRSKAHFPP